MRDIKVNGSFIEIWNGWASFWIILLGETVSFRRETVSIVYRGQEFLDASWFFVIDR